MPDNKVLFKLGTWEQYHDLTNKDSNTLYFVVDATHQEIWKGNELFSRGTLVTDELAGLMSPQQKIALDHLIGLGGGISGLPTYELEKQTTAESGSIASYKLKKTVGETVTYEGDTINIPSDKVLKSGSLEYVTTADSPYPDAEVGDPYLDLVLEDASNSHVYIPVKNLVDVPTAGDGIAVLSNIVSIKLDTDNAHGLKVTSAGLALDLATATSDGAMSKEDKAFIDSIPDDYALKSELSSVTGSIEWGAIEESNE